MGDPRVFLRLGFMFMRALVYFYLYMLVYIFFLSFIYDCSS